MIRILAPLTAGVLLSACWSSRSTREIYDEQRCIAPPEGFSESDLIGTWIAERSDNVDILVLRDDHKYRQMMRVSHPVFAYQSDWLPWRVEYGVNSIPYIHLEGMHLCAYWPEMDCAEVGGGERIWFDSCTEDWIKMPNEGVLIVLGSGKGFMPPPRGITLNLPRKFTIGSMQYKLQEP